MPTPPPDSSPPTAERHGPGRPTLLNDEVQARIVQVVRAGNYVKVAAQFAGVSESTLKSWLTRGRRAAAAIERGEDPPDADLRYVDFLAVVTQADTRAEVAAATAWRAQFGNDWRAARDYLARRHPDRWALTHRVQLSTEEAEARTDRAVWEVLTTLGIDTPEPTSRTLGAPDDDDTTELLSEMEDEDRDAAE